MVARNDSVENKSGLFFCWYNSNGVYTRNQLKSFSGYPDSGDSWNTLAFNRIDSPLHITVGYNGCIFANDVPSITLFGLADEGRKVAEPGGARSVYDLPPRYFTIALNRTASVMLHKFAYGNVIADNTYLRRGKPFPTTVSYQVSPDSESGPLDSLTKCIIGETHEPPVFEGLPKPIDRTAPEPPPAPRAAPTPPPAPKPAPAAAAPRCWQ